jgi:bacterioferritin-associated ferredoxin
MIVCICKSISDRAVRAAREAGARTLEAVAALTGAGTDCGCCHGEIRETLADPCDKAAPCSGCPNRAAAGAVPRRAAAAGVATP